MLYLLLFADSFRESTIEELSRSGRYRILDETHNAMIVELTVKGAAQLGKSVFVNGYFPIYAKSAIGSKEHVKYLHSQIRKLGIAKDAGLKLEIYNINCRDKYSAKDLEVRIGLMLEKDKYNIEIINPEVLAYCIMLNGTCYCGYIDIAKSGRSFIDPFRKYKTKLVSRAEYKIMEAFDAFDLAAPRIAIDIGAAPGGWSLFLAKKGSAVIAIDSGALDSDSIKEAGIRISVLKKSAKKAAAPEKGSILHIKCAALQALKMLHGIDADMLGDDINSGGIASSGLVLKYARLLGKDASLVMTVKCIHRNVGKYMKEVEKLLKPSFKVIGWKVLPHNRQEITLYARKK